MSETDRAQSPTAIWVSPTLLTQLGTKDLRRSLHRLVFECRCGRLPVLSGPGMSSIHSLVENAPNTRLHATTGANILEQRFWMKTCVRTIASCKQSPSAYKIKRRLSGRCRLVPIHRTSTPTKLNSTQGPAGDLRCTTPGIRERRQSCLVVPRFFYKL